MFTLVFLFVSVFLVALSINLSKSLIPMFFGLFKTQFRKRRIYMHVLILLLISLTTTICLVSCKGLYTYNVTRVYTYSSKQPVKQTIEIPTKVHNNLSSLSSKLFYYE